MILPALAILLSAAVAQPGDATVMLLDGSAISGRVTAWDADRVVIDAADGHWDVARDRLLDVRWNRPESAASPCTSVELIDGAKLRITEFTAAGRATTVETPYADEPLTIARELVRVAELQLPSDATAAMWNQLREREVAGDVLIVAKRERGLLDYLVGVVGDVTADEVAFDYEGQKLPVKRSKVAAIAYYRADEPQLPEVICELSFADGSQIPARSIELDGAGRLRIITPTGLRLSAPLAELVRADYSAGKLAYLSDLQPEQTTWTPRIETPDAASLIAEYGQPRNDVSYSGSALSLAWADESQPTGRELRTYAKGLAVRSRTDLVYRLPAGMRRFNAIAGIDPATANQGHVLLEIRADQRVLWEGEIDGKRPPVEITLELNAARRLQFHVDYGRNLDYGDRLHLVEARVTK